MRKTISLILCVAMIMSTLSFCFPAMALELDFGVESAENYATPAEDAGDASLLVESIIPEASGKDGATENVDPRYPGAYYKLPEGYTYVEATVSLENIGLDNVTGYDIEEEGKTLVLFSAPRDVVPGATLSFGAAKTFVKAVDAENNEIYVTLPEVTYTLAEELPDDGQNMFPYGDYENGFAPLVHKVTSDSQTLYAPYVAEEDGNHYVMVVDGETRYEAATKNGRYPHLHHEGITWDSGATYYLSAKVKDLGTEADEGEVKGKEAFFIDIVTGSTTAGAVASDIKITNDGGEETSVAIGSANTSEKTLGLPNWPYWFGINGTFTLPELGKQSGTISFAFYANTTSVTKADGSFVQRAKEFAFDDISLYKRIDVVYGAGDYTTLSEEATAPERNGVWLAGPLKTASNEVTIAEMPYTAKAGVTVDADKPWIDVATGNTYAAGDTVALTTTLYLVPNVTAVENAGFDVTFTGDVSGLPEKLLDLEAGTVLDLTEYYEGVKSAVDYKRFNGWTTVKGGNVPMESITVNADTTVYAIVNYDINFAIPANKTGLVNSTSRCTVDFTGDYATIKHTEHNHTDMYICIEHLNVPGLLIDSIDIYTDKTYTMHTLANYADSGNSHAVTETITTAVGDRIFEGIYFKQTGDSAWAGGRLLGYNTNSVSTIVDEKYALTSINVNTSANWSNLKNATGLRIDPYENTANGSRLATRELPIRYIHFKTPEVAKSVALTGLTAPVLGETAVTTVTAPATVTAAVEWSPAPANGVFEGSTVYTAKVKLTPAKNVGIDATTAVTIDGTAATVKDNGDGTVTASYTFAKTASSDNYEIAVSTESPAVDMAAGTITADGNGIAFTVAVTGEDAEKATEAGLVVESSNETVAIAEVDGTNITVTPIKDGTFTLRVYSNRDVYVYVDYTFAVSLAEGCKVVNISFAGNVKEVPAATTRIADADGVEFDLGDYLGVTSAVSGQRFNGWTPTDAIADLETGVATVTDDTVFTAVVNYDFNFAIPSNVDYFMAENATFVYNEDTDLITLTGALLHLRLKVSTNSIIPGALVDKVVIYTDKNSIVQNGASVAVEEGTQLFKYLYLGFNKADWQDWYYNNPNNAAAQNDAATIVGDYAASAFDVRWLWDANTTVGSPVAFDDEAYNGDITYIRFDSPGATAGDTMSFRYLHFDLYEDTEVETLNLTVDEPATGVALDTTVEGETTAVKISDVTWTPVAPAASGLAEGDTEYTLTITLVPAEPYEYSLPVDAKYCLNGEEMTVVAANYGKKLVITKTYKTEPYADFDFTLNGPDTINDGAEYYYYAEFTGEEVATEKIIWSVDDESIATISEDGVLAPKKNGTVTITATSAYKLDVVKTKTVTIEDAKLVTVKFANDVDGDTVTEALPESVSVIAGSYFDVSKYLNYTSAVAGKRFNGWSTTGNLDNPIGMVKVVDQGNGEMVLHAVVNHDVNFAVPANFDTITGGFNGGTAYNTGNGTLGFSHSEGTKAGNGKTDGFVTLAFKSYVPTYPYKALEFYYVDSYTDFGGDYTSHANATTGSLYGKTGVTGKTYDNLYFYTDKSSGNPSIAPSAFTVTKENIDGTDYAKFYFPATGNTTYWADGASFKNFRHDIFAQCLVAGELRYVRFVPYDTYTEDMAFEIATPAVGAAPATEVTDANGTASATIAWTDADGAAVTAFEAGKIYTATITATVADSGILFRENVKATLNGQAATVSVQYGKTATVTASVIAGGYITSATGSFTMDGTDGTKPKYIQIKEDNSLGGATYSTSATSVGTLDLYIKAPADGETLTVTVDDTSIVSVAQVADEVAETDTYRLTAKGYLGEVNVTATYTKDGAVTAVSTEKVLLLTGTKYKPGLNIWTGTEEPYTFDTFYSSDLNSAAGSTGQKAFKVGTVTVEDTGTNKYIKMTGSWPHFGLVNTYPTIEAGRPFSFNFSYTSDAQEVFFALRNQDQQADTALRLGGINNTVVRSTFGKFFTEDVVITNTAENVNTKDYTNRQFQDETKSGGDIFRIFFARWANTTNAVCLDDLYAIPHYAITYHFADGETTETVYALPADGIYVVDTTKLTTGAGFALTEGGKAVSNIALANADIDLYEVTTAPSIAITTFASGDKTVTATVNGIVPSPEAFGFTGENFICWYDEANNHYYAGEDVNVADVAGKTLTAYYQTTDVPAVGHAIEGTDTYNSSYYVTSSIIDDGRTVTRFLTPYKSTLGTGIYRDSMRTGLKGSYCDTREYSIIQVMVMTKDMYAGNGGTGRTDSSTAINKVDGANLRLIFDNTYSAGLSTAYLIDKTLGTYATDGKYHLLEHNFLESGNAEKWKGFTTTYGQFGICYDVSYVNDSVNGIDPLYGADTYLDYIRVYRNGILSVNYDTNAPAGATVITNVAADTGRGAGTGYLLKGERPEVEGYTFMGWSVSKSAAAAGVTVESIDLTRDTTVYACWKKADAEVKAEDITEVRNDRFVNGFRSKATISAEFMNTVSEYGFIAAVSSLIDKQYTEGLTFNSRIDGSANIDDDIPYVFEKAYAKDGSVQNRTRKLDDGFTASAVIDYTDVDVKFYATPVTIRSYAKFNMANGAEVIVYGEAKETSLYDDAVALKDSTNAATAKYANEVIAAYDAYVAAQETTEA